MSIKIAIFASGSGSNAENIINYFSATSQIEIPLILSNRADAYVHERAKKFNIPSFTISRAELNETDIVLNILAENEIDFIVLAGFLLKLPAYLIQTYPNKIINIHPALLPKYGGKGMYGDYVHEAVVTNGEKESGITIHYVNENYDEGNIIFQSKCEVLTGDTADDVAEKVHRLEYAHFPRVIDETIRKMLL